MAPSTRFCLCSGQNEVQHSEDESLPHEQQLNENLAQNNIRRLPVEGDGNCLFYALAQGLIHEMQLDPKQFGARLEQFGLFSNIHLTTFANHLRRICVDQWKLNEDFYSEFVDKSKKFFLKEVKKFSKNGVSDSILGDIVPLTISNTFHITIIIFTSVVNFSRINIKPEHNDHLSPPSRETIIYLAYNQYGQGHYDAAYPRV